MNCLVEVEGKRFDGARSSYHGAFENVFDGGTRFTADIAYTSPALGQMSMAGIAKHRDDRMTRAES